MSDKQAPTEPVTVKLTEPIMMGGEETGELTVQVPKLKHLAALDDLRLAGNPETGSVELSNLPKAVAKGIRVLCNLTEREAGELSISDAARVGKVVLGFFGLSLEGIGASKSGQ